MLLLLAGSPAGQERSGGPVVGWRPIPAPGAALLPPPSPGPPPELPAAAHTISPSTIDLVFQRAGAELVRHAVTRTEARVHVRQSASREWLYVRNPRDPRRVNGALADHTRRVIIQYGESDLRNWQGVRGWLDVLTLGVDPWSVGSPVPGEASRQLGSLSFVRYDRVLAEGAERTWWCAGELLPLEALQETPAGRTVLTVERIDQHVDRDLLADLEVRYPDYQAIDLAEWLERR